MKKIIIVGNGISGLSAAIEAAERGCYVTVVSPYVPERSQSVMAAAGINAAVNSMGEGDSAMLHAEDTYKAGQFIENKENIIGFCESGPENLRWLENMGIAFNRNDDNSLSLRKLGGHCKKRTAYFRTSTGKQIVTGLALKCRQYSVQGRMNCITGVHFYSALIKDEVCYGILVCNALTGELTPLYADAVIIASGGQNLIYGKTTGSLLCDGYAQGKLFAQGVGLRNLEFIQFHPTATETSDKMILISEAARGEGGRLYYVENGKRVYFMEDKFGPSGNLMPRDVISQCMYGSPSQVYLDISFLDSNTINKRLREIYNICKDFTGIDVTKESIPVKPAVHFFMGGIYVDDFHRTNVVNLFAVGECASKYHGANRLGGNSLLSAVHSGRVAAGFIAENTDISKSVNPETEFEAYIRSERRYIENMANSKSLFPSVYMLEYLSGIMSDSMGIVRNGEKMKNGMKDLDFFLKVLKKLSFDPSVSLYENYRLYYMFLLAKASLTSALFREESRGAHKRSDFPEVSDSFKGASVSTYKDGECKVCLEKV